LALYVEHIKRAAQSDKNEAPEITLSHYTMI